MYLHSATARYNWSLNQKRVPAVPAAQIRQPSLESLRAYHSDSFGWALACCFWNRDAAEDVLQESYLRILEGKAKFAGKSSPKTWFFGVIKRVAMETHRQQKRQSELNMRLVADDDRSDAADDTAQNCTLAESLSVQESSRQLATCLMLLSERQREVLHLIFYSELTLEEASAVLQVSLGSARTHYHRGKQRLSQLLEEAEIDSEGVSDEN
ncbi:MAG: RNA polymerase sigma factor [Halioglobus sp.]